MQRILIALVALISIMTTGIRPLNAQENGAPADPPTTPQRIDEHPSGSAHVTPPRVRPPAGAVVIGAETTTENLTVRNHPLILEGHIRHDVLAINSDVTILPGASVGGHLVAIGGNVHNGAGGTVKVIEQSRDLANSLNSSFMVSASVRTTAPPKKDDWFGGQLGLLVLGLLGGLLVLVGAPKAAQRVSESIAISPARSLTVGLLTALGLLVVLAFNDRLMHVTFIGLMWSPFGTLVALAAAMVMGFGWLSGMRYAGNIIAHRFGRPQGGGTLYGRIALSLCLFFGANVVLGSISRTLGVASLTLECIVAVMGLGAAVATGFGREADWLGARLRGETRWTSPHI